ncbi:synapse-associated protein 1-like [Acipenser oxyrinchus oxyrinchus]|uniref:Synapse-associated protein 1-like n=1 Tax=Acipenser oxyrinchus oxyrinchus TaxID=40147 RepID=A0AAD8FTK2_ACIOX|nr:synapse-associated protein 1-like [Acipenser oxyrinchus oxyrinchus]
MFKSLSFSNWLSGPGDIETLGPEGETTPTAGHPGTEENTKTEKLTNQTKRIGSYLFGVAALASKKVSESVLETAQTIRKSVDQHPINGIIDKTILGDFKREQESFVKEQQQRKAEAAVPLWVGYSDEESMKQQILSLSLDRRNFLRDPPAGVHFQFDFSQAAPVAMVTLQEDAMLSRMRFELVPRHVKEEVFWRNYFYRVSLVRQSAQLSLLASQHTERQRDTERGSGDHTPSTDATAAQTPPISVRNTRQIHPLVSLDDVSVSPPSGEFVSDSFNTSLSLLNQEDLLRDRKQLGMGQGEKDPAVEQEQDEIPEWERELQRELQEFEVVEPGERGDASEAWEREIEELLLEDF